jgi:hypothetical protein
VIAHGMWGAALISAVLGTALPGAGTVYERQTLNFRAPIRAGDTLTTTVKVTARDERESLVTLDCTCVNQRGQTVIAGEAVVTAPTARIERSRSTLPQVRISVSQGDDLVRCCSSCVRSVPSDGRRSSDRRRQPVGCARCARGGAHRAGARRAARASRSGREGGRALARRRADRGPPDARSAAARAVELACKAASAR